MHMPTTSPRHRDIIRADYWRELCPELSVTGGMSTAPEMVAISDQRIAELRRRMALEGYVVVPGMLSADTCQNLATGIQRVVDAGFPAPFAAVFDEYWQLAGQFRPLICGMVGEDARISADFWMWCVDGVTEATGWSPHRDASTAIHKPSGGALPVMTLWIPFTDVDSHNGCISVLPKQHDPNLPNAEPGKDIPMDALPYVRALHGRAGDLMCWDMEILHWGGVHTPHAKAPRVSFGFYAQSTSIPPIGGGYYAPEQLPDFDTRLATIFNMILKYQGIWYEFPEDLMAIGRKITLVQQLVQRQKLGNGHE